MFAHSLCGSNDKDTSSGLVMGVVMLAGVFAIGSLLSEVRDIALT